jgi:hypothetical protein
MSESLLIRSHAGPMAPDAHPERPTSYHERYNHPVLGHSDGCYRRDCFRWKCVRRHLCFLNRHLKSLFYAGTYQSFLPSCMAAARCNRRTEVTVRTHHSAIFVENFALMQSTVMIEVSRSHISISPITWSIFHSMEAISLVGLHLDLKNHSTHLTVNQGSILR